MSGGFLPNLRIVAAKRAAESILTPWPNLAQLR